MRIGTNPLRKIPQETGEHLQDRHEIGVKWQIDVLPMLIVHGLDDLLHYCDWRKRREEELVEE